MYRVRATVEERSEMATTTSIQPTAYRLTDDRACKLGSARPGYP